MSGIAPDKEISGGGETFDGCFAGGSGGVDSDSDSGGIIGVRVEVSDDNGFVVVCWIVSNCCC